MWWEGFTGGEFLQVGRDEQIIDKWGGDAPPVPQEEKP